MSALELTMMKRINELNEEVKLLKADNNRLKAEVDDLKLAARLVIKHLDETGEIDCETILNLRASAGIL